MKTEHSNLKLDHDHVCRLVLLERDSSYSSWPSLIQNKKIADLTIEQVVKKYQGFEGELVCSFEVTGNTDELQNYHKECSKLNELGSCVMLFVISVPDAMPLSLRAHAMKLGYDIGVCEEEVIYSSIFHEILFGHYAELVAYKDFLNENLLFFDKSLAEQYVNLHNEMSAQGKQVEDYMEMGIYEIWRHKDKIHINQ